MDKLGRMLTRRKAKARSCRAMTRSVTNNARAPMDMLGASLADPLTLMVVGLDPRAFSCRKCPTRCSADLDITGRHLGDPLAVFIVGLNPGALFGHKKIGSDTDHRNSA